MIHIFKMNTARKALAECEENRSLSRSLLLVKIIEITGTHVGEECIFLEK